MRERRWRTFVTKRLRSQIHVRSFEISRKREIGRFNRYLDRVEGYIKPFFKDMKVYHARQDREKSLFRKLYEGLIGGVAKLLENRPRGGVKDPEASTWQVIVNLVRNAFFRQSFPVLKEKSGPHDKW